MSCTDALASSSSLSVGLEASLSSSSTVLIVDSTTSSVLLAESLTSSSTWADLTVCSPLALLLYSLCEGKSSLCADSSVVEGDCGSDVGRSGSGRTKTSTLVSWNGDRSELVLGVVGVMAISSSFFIVVAIAIK